MVKSFLFAALLLTLSISAHARSLRQIEAPVSETVVGNSPNPATAANNVALVTEGEQPVVPPDACSNAKSPIGAASTGTRFSATLSGTKNIKPNTTGVAAPVVGPSKGTYVLLVDEPAQTASWTLEMCDVPAYVASHLHTGSPIADFVPPLIPLEPYVKAANPFAPPNLLPQLCPPVNITGCTYTAQGSFSNEDIAPLLGREPQGDLEAPSVLNFADFVRVLKAGKIYINVHSKLAPAGLMRGNLEMAVTPAGSPAAESPVAESLAVSSPAAGSPLAPVGEVLAALSPATESPTAEALAAPVAVSPAAESPVAEAPAAGAPAAESG